MTESNALNVIVNYEKSKETSKWGFTALFGGCSITYSGYDTKDEAMLVFERLKGNLKL